MMKYVECSRDEYTLRGMLHIPEGASSEYKVPLVVILNGFGADRNDSFGILVALSRKLCQEGIASVRFDYMGSGESDGEFSNMSILTETKDAEAVLRYVKTLDFVDTERIAMHGFSQGGMVSLLTAARHPEEIACVSTWAPALCIHDCCKAKNIQGICIEGIAERGWIDYHGIKLGAAYYLDGISSNVFEEVGKYKKPVHILHGKADRIVPCEYSVRMKKILGDTCSLHLAEGMEHANDSVEYNEVRIEEASMFLSSQLSQN